MPTLNKSLSLTITPEQFLAACSRHEIIEINLLLSSPRYEAMLNENAEDHHEETMPTQIAES